MKLFGINLSTAFIGSLLFTAGTIEGRKGDITPEQYCNIVVRKPWEEAAPTALMQECVEGKKNADQLMELLATNPEIAQKHEQSQGQTLEQKRKGYDDLYQQQLALHKKYKETLTRTAEADTRMDNLDQAQEILEELETAKTRAWIAAKKKQKTETFPSQHGHRLLTKPNVPEVIELQKILKKFLTNPEFRIDKLAQNMPQKFFEEALKVIKRERPDTIFANTHVHDLSMQDKRGLLTYLLGPALPDQEELTKRKKLEL